MGKKKKKENLKEKRKNTHLTGNVRVQIVTPINMKWDEIGPHMHAIRGMTHRCLNDAVSRVAIEDAMTRAGEGGKTWGPAAYAAIEKRLEEERVYAEKRFEKANLALVGLEKKIATIKNKKKLEELEQKKRSETWNVEHFGVIRQMFALTSGIKDAMASRAISAFKLFKKESYLGSRSLPSFRNNSPIYVRDGQHHWNIYKDDRGFVLEVKLHPGRVGKVKFVLKTEHGGEIAHLQRMTDKKALDSGLYKLGDLKLIWHKKKWLAQMSYSWPKPLQKEIDMNRVVAVRRGIRHFMVLASTGKNPYVGPWMSGGDVVAAKQQFDSRALKNGKRYKLPKEDNVFEKKKEFAERLDSLRKHNRELSDSAKLHGVARREQRITSLRTKEKNWVRTKCQQVAAWLVSFCVKRGIGLILLEDWNKEIQEFYLEQCDNEHLKKILQQFPFYMLKECIEWAAKKEGISVKVVSVQYVYSICPKCGYEDEDQYNKRSRLFECFNPKCKTKRPLEFIMAWHMLKQGGAGGVDVSMERAERNTREAVNQKAKKIKNRRKGCQQFESSPK
jgi:IS605 OrfB family transposase